MPSEYPLFPSRDQMRDYIMGFAAHHGLGSDIRFNTAVTSARPVDANGLAGWEVTTSNGESRTYDGVVGLLRGDEREHLAYRPSLSFAKKAAAFARISRSIRSFAFSSRSRLSS
jgi:Flavin-binding monooxygenase-like